MILPALILSLHNPVTDLLPGQQNHQIVLQSSHLDKQILRQKLSVREAIRLAKQAARLQPSGPRIYETGAVFVEAWPDRSGSLVTTYNNCPKSPENSGQSVSCQAPMTLRVVVEPSISRRGYRINFESRWERSGSSYRHSWLFEVGGNRRVSFLREEGDRLPSRI